MRRSISSSGPHSWRVMKPGPDQEMNAGRIQIPASTLVAAGWSAARPCDDELGGGKRPRQDAADHHAKRAQHALPRVLERHPDRVIQLMGPRSTSARIRDTVEIP